MSNVVGGVDFCDDRKDCLWAVVILVVLVLLIACCD